MVWIRRVRTASGSTAVQIAESVGGRRRIVRHVGSARDDAELGLLIEAAQRLLVDDSQGELDVNGHLKPPVGGQGIVNGQVNVPSGGQLQVATLCGSSGFC